MCDLQDACAKIVIIVLAHAYVNRNNTSYTNILYYADQG